MIEDLTLSSIRRVVTDLIHFGLSTSLSWGLKAESSFSSWVHFSELISQSSGCQALSPKGTLLITRFRVGITSVKWKL